MLQSATERPRLSWDEFKAKNQGRLPKSSVEDMIKYRQELDRQREKVWQTTAVSGVLMVQ